uniref:Uncharacterized protein n=1 Tax=Wuchereria bancrofti TaxID=6293 RepID=A0A1I8EN24_WUCBA
MDEKLSSISDHPSKYSSQRHPRRMLRRQVTIFHNGIVLQRWFQKYMSQMKGKTFPFADQ